VDAAVFRNVGTGLLDRGFLLATAITVPLGAHMRARHDAYYDAAIGRGRREVRRLVGAGAGLVVLGGLATVASEAMWWQCAIGDEGPYHTGGTSEFPDDFSNRRRRPCNYDVARTVVDLGTAAFSAGAGMLVYGLRYRHDSRIYARARFVLVPTAAPGRGGLAMVGRF
jgi:hypothetical protein